MQYVTLGRTGLKVSVMSLGALPLQKGDAENAARIVSAAEKGGVNFIDTAKGYTVSEGYLGRALEGRRGKFLLATKSMARDRDGMARDVEDSLEKLKTDYIELYQFHNVPAKDLEKIFGEGGAYEALAEAKRLGKIGHIGLTAHHTETLEAVYEKYSDKIETVMFPFNIVENQGEAMLRKLHEKGIGTIAMKPLAGGNLDDLSLAFRYIANSGVIDVMLPGMATAAEAEEDIPMADDLRPLSEEELSKVLGIRKALGTTFCRRCGYCLPCTVGINIPSVFLFRNYNLKYHMGEWSEKRYAALDPKASACIECGACEERCPYGLPIRDMMKDAVRIFGK